MLLCRLDHEINSGDLANPSLADLAVILALGLCDKGLDLLSVDKLNIGIVISHNKTLYYAEEKLLAVRNRVANRNLGHLLAVLDITGEDSTDLIRKLYINTYDIPLVPGQSAISTDLDI